MKPNKNETRARGNGHGHAKPAQIEREIEDTRARMEQTIQAIRQDLSPRELIDHALHATKTGDIATSLGRAVRDNPIPTAMVGIGLTWLVVSGTRSSRSSAAGIEGIERIETDESRERGDRLEAAKADLEETAKAKEVSLKEKAAALKERAHDVTHGAAERARATKERAGDAAVRAKDATSRTFETQPLVVGAIAVGIGALIGALLPSTPREDQVLGGARDALRNRAAGVGKDVLHRDASGREARTIIEETRVTSSMDERGVIP